MMFLARYWRVVAVAAAVGLALFTMQRCTERAEQRGYERATAEHAAQVAKANAATAARDAAARKAFQANESKWIGERSELQDQIADLLERPPVVRVCKPAAADHREVPRAVAAAGSPGGAGQQGVDPLPVSRDIGPELTRLFGECESYRRRLIELKGRWPE